MMTYRIQYSVSVQFCPARVALKQDICLLHARPSSTKIIPLVEIRQENLSIDRFQNISWSFVEMVGEIKMRPIFKMWQKLLLFRQLQFLLAFFCVQQYTHATVINIHFDNQGARAPQFSFCQPIKMYNRAEIKSFFLKSCSLGLSSDLFKNLIQ